MLCGFNSLAFNKYQIVESATVRKRESSFVRSAPGRIETMPGDHSCMTGPSGKSFRVSAGQSQNPSARSSRLSSLGRPLRAASLRAASRPAEEKRLIILLTTGRVTFSSSLANLGVDLAFCG